MTAVLSAVSVADRVAMIEEHLEALAGVPDVELTSDSAFDATASVLRVRRRVDALAARTSAAYATSGDWGIDGARSAKALLVGRKVESFGVVGRLLRAGAFMSAHPGYGSAAMAGACTLDHLIAVDAAYANYPRLRGALDAAESHILSWATTSAPAHFKALLADLCHRLDPDAVDEADAKKRRETFLDAVTTFEGYVNVSGFLDPETGQQLIAMLESARRAVPAEDDPDAPVDPRSAQRRNVEALHRILNLAAARTGPMTCPPSPEPDRSSRSALLLMICWTMRIRRWVGSPASATRRPRLRVRSPRTSPVMRAWHRSWWTAPGRSWPHSPKSAPSRLICAPRS